jgi:hypothetical protein
MSTPAVASPAPTPFFKVVEARVKPYLAPYYLTVAGVLGLMTVGFIAAITVLIIVAANFNVLDWIE